MSKITVAIALLFLAAPTSAQVRALNIEFGIKDDKATKWDGSVSVSTGSVVKLRGHHFTEEAKLGPDNSWEASTTEWVGYGGGMHPHELPFSHATRAMTIGVTVYYQAPDDAKMTVKTEQGDFTFRIGDVPLSAPIHLLASRVEVFRVPPVEHITTEQYEDDYPSLAAGADGTVTAAWIGYRDEADRVLVRRR
ncbi:MAG: hypothetical protein GY953_57250, partial [bacterium]|nr:hypothetical protein [bacterium]